MEAPAIREAKNQAAPVSAVPEAPAMLWRFEVVKTIIRFFVIGLLGWFVMRTLNTTSPFWMALFGLLMLSNAAYLGVILLLRHRVSSNFLLLRFFHYASLILCLLTFGGIVTLTGLEKSDYFLFYVFYLSMMPIVQVEFPFEETVLSEVLIVAAYLSTLFVMGHDLDMRVVLLKAAFLALIAATNLVFSWLLKREHTLLQHANHRLHNLAITDPLTGLYNRRYLQEEISREIARARREGSRVSVIVGDLDDFKDFNDAYGHLEGDKILADIAGALLRNTRQMDIVARYGGEEFVIVLPATEKEEACEVAERIRDEVAALTKERCKHPITITQGIATYPDDARDELQLLSRADRAMYEAKKLGKNRISSCKGMLG